MNNKEKQTVATIGAGVAGSICANLLKAQGFDPIIIEKSKGVGGRLATCRADTAMSFDHGVQFFTAQSGEFQLLLEKSLSAGAIGSWRPVLFEDQSEVNANWFVGKPTMNALVKPLLKNIQINFSEEVSSIVREGENWRIKTLSDKTGELFQNVICTVPAPEVSFFLRSEKELLRKIADVKIAPCWALLLAFEHSLDLGFDVWKSDVENIAWIARNSSKPSREKNYKSWVLHASPEWSGKNLEIENDQVTRVLFDELCAIFGSSFSNAFYTVSHRWRYARTVKPLLKPYLCTADKFLFIGGDWCLGPRVENAYTSGFEMAKSFIDNSI